MTLNEVMKDTADAIREKKGTSELIAPVNFAEEIKSISAGGGESGIDHLWVYLTKEDFFMLLDKEIPTTMTQEEFRKFCVDELYIYPYVTMRNKKGGVYKKYGIWADDILPENRFKYEDWDAIQIDFAQYLYADNSGDGNYFPWWRMFGVETKEQFNSMFDEMFPNQLTREQYFGQ